MTPRTYNFVSFIVKIILSGLASVLSAPFANKTQYFVHVSLMPILQLIYGISSNLQKLLTYFNGTAIAVFLKIPFGPSASVFPNSLVLYLKDLKLLLLSTTSSFKLVASSLEKKT